MMGKITIHNDEWTIKYFNDNIRTSNIENKDCPYGTTVTSTLTIYIRKDLIESVLKSVVLREVARAYIFSYAIPITGKYDIDNIALESIVCDFISGYSEEIIKSTNDIMRMISNAEINI